ncbi:hypothetical protein BJ165DRAFT_1614141 [Panaeolus papilionaceus]|nr:hypothetical protein BJ165DRAFT_1614141 [Panaeolus papilionaceus]
MSSSESGASRTPSETPRKRSKVYHTAKQEAMLESISLDPASSSEPQSKDISKLCETVELSTHACAPYISGTFPLSSNETVLFYCSEAGEAGFVDFSSPSPSSLQSLTSACQPASFGLNGQKIIDPTYRKAYKLDASHFATQFSPEAYGILDILTRDFFNGDMHPGLGIRLQMYKLNVYGPGSFFKPHVDTPQGSEMFGSLVVVLPTPHEGGNLIIRHTDQEWTIDAATAVSRGVENIIETTSSDSTSPEASASQTAVLNKDPSKEKNPIRVAFAAFYSDVEHEVTPVISGYRITLTYLLYFTTPSTPSPSNPRLQLHSSALHTLTSALASLLSHPPFLSNGGLIAYKLAHRYPLELDTHQTRTSVADLFQLGALKGPDARLLSAFNLLGLTVTPRLFYEFTYRNKHRVKYMTDQILQPSGTYFDINGIKKRELEDDVEEIKATRIVKDLDLERGEGLTSVGTDLLNLSKQTHGRTRKWGRRSIPNAKGHPPVPIYWINPAHAQLTKVGSPYAYASDCEAEVGYIYGEIALVAQVGPVGDRRNRGVQEGIVKKGEAKMQFDEGDYVFS